MTKNRYRYFVEYDSTASSKNCISINFNGNLCMEMEKKSVIFTSIHCYRDVVFVLVCMMFLFQKGPAILSHKSAES